MTARSDAQSGKKIKHPTVRAETREFLVSYTNITPIGATLRTDLYPELAKQRKESGNVRIDLLLDTLGEIRKTNVLFASDSIFIPAAEKAARDLRFTPPVTQYGHSMFWSAITVQFYIVGDSAYTEIPSTNARVLTGGIKALKSSPLGNTYDQVLATLRRDYEEPKKSERYERTIFTANRPHHDTTQPDDVEVTFLANTLVKVVLYYDLLTPSEYAAMKSKELGGKNIMEKFTDDASISYAADDATKSITLTYTPP